MRRPVFSIILIIFILGLLTNESANQPPPPPTTTPSPPPTCPLPELNWDPFIVDPITIPSTPDPGPNIGDNERVRNVARIIYPETLVAQNTSFNTNYFPLFAEFVNEVDQERSNLVPFIATMYQIVPENMMRSILQHISRMEFPFGIGSTVLSVTARVRNIISGIPSGEFLQTTLRNMVVDGFRSIGINLLNSNEEFQSLFQITPQEAWSMIVAWVLDCQAATGQLPLPFRPPPPPPPPPSRHPPTCPLPNFYWNVFVFEPLQGIPVAPIPTTTTTTITVPTQPPGTSGSQQLARIERVTTLSNIIYPETLSSIMDETMGQLYFREFARFVTEADHERPRLQPFINTIISMLPGNAVPVIIKLMTRIDFPYSWDDSATSSASGMRNKIRRYSGDALRRALENIVVDSFLRINFNILPSNQRHESTFQITIKEAWVLIVAWLLETIEGSRAM